MRRRDWIAGFSLLLALAVIAFLMIPPGPVMLGDLETARTTIEAEGFACASGRADGLPTNGFLVSREELPWETANNLCKAGPMGPEWKGKVWVCQRVQEMRAITPDNAVIADWGGVVAFGDSEILGEIEASLRRNRRAGV